MMPFREAITADRLREIYNYNPDTGIFTRAICLNRRWPVGTVAGTLRKKGHGAGYVSINCGGVVYLAHRLAWLYVTGEWPKQLIDHINGDPADNRFCNLRDVSQVENQQNRRKPKHGTTSALLGVYRAQRTTKRQWYAAIRANGIRFHLGTFQTEEQAHAAYLAAKREMHEGCTI